MVKGRPKPAPTSKTVDVWAIQCDECFKWRRIATQEEFEEIRSKCIEDPFICSKKPDVSCNDPADIEYDSTRTWVADKPNIPVTPVGFKRRLVMRSDHTKMDIYYTTPTGRSLRSSTEVVTFLKENLQYKEISPSNFSFTRPKIMEDTVPGSGKKKLAGN